MYINGNVSAPSGIVTSSIEGNTFLGMTGDGVGITSSDNITLSSNAGVNINAKNGDGSVNINGSVLAQDGIATASVTSLDGQLELVSDDMDITAGGQICMNGSTGISINCPTDILIESTNSSVNINGNVMVNGNNIADLFAEIQSLKTRVTALETVNQDLENIIALQQSYIGGDEA